MITLEELPKIKVKKLSDKLVPRDWFQLEDEYLTEIGVRIKLGTNWKADNIHEGRLYLQKFDKKEQKEILSDLKSFGVYPAIIGSAGTVICVYHNSSARILFFYCKGREIDCQGVFKIIN